MSFVPCLLRSSTAVGDARYALGHSLLDRYLEFVAGRSRPNTLRAVAFDLKTFFVVVDKDPIEVVAADVFEFLAHQRGDRTVIRMSDRESGLSARTIARRLSSVSGLYAYLVARGDTPITVNPVPRGLSTRRQGGRSRTVPLVQVPRTLPKILSPAEVSVLLSALRAERDRAMVLAMLLGACAAARSSDCASRMCASGIGRCSSPKAKVATNGSCPSPMRSSLPSATTCATSDRRRRRTACSSR